ncbi:MAG: hypothetical protein MZW92_37260 [Comamonadaceae bacterium]|nr:hypothetical protein [Comamonadaceae bacterium]
MRFDGENLPVEIFTMAGLRRLPLDQSEGSRPVGPPLGAQEQNVLRLSLEEAVRQIVQMRDEKDLDALLQQGADDLPRDLRALPLVRRGK